MVVVGGERGGMRSLLVPSVQSGGNSALESGWTTKDSVGKLIALLTIWTPL